MKLLVLGGTRFLGRHIVDAARARNHAVTVFTRGRQPSPRGDGVVQLIGDRDPRIAPGLAALEKEHWDGVIDTSGYVPRIVKMSAELLAPAVRQYVFISSISVYPDDVKPGANETTPVQKLTEPGSEEVRKHYGALKALCEEAAEAAMPGRTTNVRPGLIVGPGDPTDRYTYWPVRMDRPGEALAPGTGEDPVQYVDVRDLAAWIVQTANGSFSCSNAISAARSMRSVPRDSGRWAP